MRRVWTGRDAWRNGFTANAGDVLQVQRLFAWDTATFQRALLLCARYTRGERTNERTVYRVLKQMTDEYNAAQALAPAGDSK